MSATTSATIELNDTAPGARRRSAAVRWVVAVARFAWRKPLGALGGVIVVAMLVMAAFAEQIAPYRFDETIRGARMTPPSAAHWLGTDNLSRDMWSRVVYGARVSVTVGFGTIALAIVVATAVGVSSAYFGGLWDLAVQRVVDAWLSFPYLVIILSVMAVLGPGRLNLIISVAIIAAASNSRVIRGATLGVMQSQFVEAARAIGCGHARIIVRHLLPNVAATIIILTTIGLGAVSSPSPPSRSWASVCRRRTRRGVQCFRAPAAPTCCARRGWRCGRAWRSRSPSSASTCSATPCVTCSILGCAADADPLDDGGGGE